MKAEVVNYGLPWMSPDCSPACFEGACCQAAQRSSQALNFNRAGSNVRSGSIFTRVGKHES